jgi:hypothetical protein
LDFLASKAISRLVASSSPAQTTAIAWATPASASSAAVAISTMRAPALFSSSTIVVASASSPLTMMWRRMLIPALPQSHHCGRWHGLGSLALALSRPA